MKWPVLRHKNISTTDKNKGMPDFQTTTRNLLLLLCQLHLQRKWQFGDLKKSAMKTGRSRIEASPPERWWLSLKTSHLQPETMRCALWEIFSPARWNASRAREGKKKNVNSPKILIKSHACISIFHKSKNILQDQNNSFKQSFSGHLILRFHQLTKFFFKILSLRSTWARNLGWLVLLMVKLQTPTDHWGSKAMILRLPTQKLQNPIGGKPLKILVLKMS